GLALNAEGEVGPQARRAERLAEAIRALTSLPVILHDESFSTQAATEALRASRGSPSGGGKGRRKRREQIHAVAAAAILQSYLDAHPGRDQTT
ncbi:MAG: RuvX/YqgF family protein, partial [Anaerolineales bacterium]